MNYAVIFDFNGVIFNDELLHQDSWRLLCKKHGWQIKEEDYPTKVFGRREKETFEFLLQKELSWEEVEAYSNERIEIVESFLKGKMPLPIGLRELFDTLEQAKIPKAIATSSMRRYLDYILDGASIRNYFQVIVTAEDVVRSKPDPEVYLKAASGLGITCEKCIVIEDTINGIHAGKAAGMKVIGITSTSSAAVLKEADLIIDSFHKLNLPILEELISGVQ